ncbi:MAG: sodium-dependent transporter, partial [Candidatus Latescibacteria bacterium]|nr:sodium-dependent transporter [Candidatus Latescibacterota bacterium]
YAMGKGTRMGTIGAFGKLLGPRFAWMGAFVGFVSTAIMFYYSVVTGWCLYYLFLALSGSLTDLGIATTQEIWNGFIHSYQPLFFHLVAMA